MTERPKSIPCALSEPEGDQRGAAWRALGPRVRSRARTAGGFRVVFDLAALERVEQLAAAERSCCGWATWSVQAYSDRVALEVTGPDAPVEALAAAFRV
ncbi:MAG TPA: hypothetical protein VG405_00485 [Solirubrobacteraceae bacterium]|nr:hypothetical protein [Solirubrobacteraceae bacterium]